MKVTTETILQEMAKTHSSRNVVYGSSRDIAGAVFEAMFPDGVALNTAHDHEIWNLFNLVMTKLLRFVASDLTHIDSIHDLAVYAAMVETSLRNQLRNPNESTNL